MTHNANGRYLVRDSVEADTGHMGKCNGFKEEALSGFGAIL